MTTIEQELCTHHFLIEPHTDIMSKGVCWKCGEIRPHSNELVRTYNDTVLKSRVVNKAYE